MNPLLDQVSVAPHRSYFAAGGVGLLAASLGWVAALWAPGASAVPAQAAHGVVFLLALFGPFVFGFLTTVFARWQDAPAAPRPLYASAALLLAAGALLMPLGAARSASLFALAFALFAAGWALAGGTLAWMLWRAPVRVVHAWLALGGVALGFGAVLLASAWALGVAGLPSPLAVATPQPAETLALWGFLLPVYFAVGHRMVPFFSSVVVPDYAIYRPAWAPPAWAALCVARAALTLAAPLAAAPVLPLIDAALAAILIRHTVGWGFWRARRVRLLFALHLGFAWIGLALALGALDGGMRLAGLAGLGRAPLHALAIGGFASLLIAMVTRVSLGHSGRPLEMAPRIWLCFLAVQATAVLRVGADLAMGSLAWEQRATLLGVAGLVWLVAFAAWAMWVMPIWYRPRADGKPG